MDAQTSFASADSVLAVPAAGARRGLASRWQVSELITIGIFAAVIKVSSLAIALAGAA